MTDSDRNERGQFAEGNQAAVRHGAHGVIKRIERGQDLLGAAHERELEIYSELELAGQRARPGRGAIVRRNAVQWQVAVDLFWPELYMSAGDMDAIRENLKTGGFVVGRAKTMWEADAAENGDGQDGDAERQVILAKYQPVADDKQNS